MVCQLLYSKTNMLTLLNNVNYNYNTSELTVLIQKHKYKKYHYSLKINYQKGIGVRTLYIKKKPKL